MGALEQFRQHRDTVRQFARFARDVPKLTPVSGMSPSKVLEGWATERPEDIALLYLDERYTWLDFDRRANQYAGWFTAHGVGFGDVVAVVMDNRPDFLFALFGLSKIGAVGSLINTNLTGASLAHALRVCDAIAVLAGGEHASAVAEAIAQDEQLSRLDQWEQSEDPSATRGIQVQVRGFPETPVRQTFKPRNDHTFCYIYTSGTTGLPKAAIIKNQRMLGANFLFGHIMHRSKRRSVVYVPLPLYHSNALFLGFGAALGTGSTTALRRKFSASNFLSDVRKFDATSFVYIGELCRYLLNTPEQPDDRNHRLEAGVGNGLRGDIWETFQRRFDVPIMREFYGSTEGNALAFNIAGKPGMIGKLQRSQIVVRCDPSTGEVLRRGDGFVDQVPAGEVGLLLARINPLLGFEGYVDKKATEKKILTGVLKPNDAYFNSGDLVQLHEGRWLSFADRLGDTYRYKGENISTNEVAEILNRADGVLEANVYGVEIPNTEGRAGMAALGVDESFDLESFGQFVDENMPGYHRPLFVRILDGGMRITGTFKHQKTDYRDEGYDLSKVRDPLYLLRKGSYVGLTAELCAQVNSGEVVPG